MTALEHNTQYEIDRMDVSQAIVVRHIEDHSNGFSLFWGFVLYILLLPILIGAIALVAIL